MNKIFIVGGNGFAKECALYIQHMADVNKEVCFGGLLGHNGYKVDFKSMNNLFICDESEYDFKKDEYAVIGAGYPELRKKIYEDLKKRNIPMMNLSPANTYFNSTVEMGEGNIFTSPCSPTVHVKIGNGNLFNGDVIIGHDTEIGDYNFFGPRSQILGNVKIGNSNTIGAGAILLPKSKIGNNNKIAALSAVYKGCKNNCYMLGNPAEKIGITD